MRNVGVGEQHRTWTRNIMSVHQANMESPFKENITLKRDTCSVFHQTWGLRDHGCHSKASIDNSIRNETFSSVAPGTENELLPLETYSSGEISLILPEEICHHGWIYGDNQRVFDVASRSNSNVVDGTVQVGRSNLQSVTSNMESQFKENLQDFWIGFLESTAPKRDTRSAMFQYEDVQALGSHRKASVDNANRVNTTNGTCRIVVSGKENDLPLEACSSGDTSLVLPEEICCHGWIYGNSQRTRDAASTSNSNLLDLQSVVNHAGDEDSLIGNEANETSNDDDAFIDQLAASLQAEIQAEQLMLQHHIASSTSSSPEYNNEMEIPATKEACDLECIVPLDQQDHNDVLIALKDELSAQLIDNENLVDVVNRLKQQLRDSETELIQITKDHTVVVDSMIREHSLAVHHKDMQILELESHFKMELENTHREMEQMIFESASTAGSLLETGRQKVEEMRLDLSRLSTSLNYSNRENERLNEENKHYQQMLLSLKSGNQEVLSLKSTPTRTEENFKGSTNYLASCDSSNLNSGHIGLGAAQVDTIGTTRQVPRDFEYHDRNLQDFQASEKELGTLPNPLYLGATSAYFVSQKDNLHNPPEELSFEKTSLRGECQSRMTSSDDTYHEYISDIHNLREQSIHLQLDLFRELRKHFECKAMGTKCYNGKSTPTQSVVLQESIVSPEESFWLLLRSYQYQDQEMKMSDAIVDDQESTDAVSIPVSVFASSIFSTFSIQQVHLEKGVVDFERTDYELENDLLASNMRTLPLPVVETINPYEAFSQTSSDENTNQPPVPNAFAHPQQDSDINQPNEEQQMPKPAFDSQQSRDAAARDRQVNTTINRQQPSTGVTKGSCIRTSNLAKPSRRTIKSVGDTHGICATHRDSKQSTSIQSGDIKSIRADGPSSLDKPVLRYQSKNNKVSDTLSRLRQNTSNVKTEEEEADQTVNDRLRLKPTTQDHESHRPSLLDIQKGRAGQARTSMLPRNQKNARTNSRCAKTSPKDLVKKVAKSILPSTHATPRGARPENSFPDENIDPTPCEVDSTEVQRKFEFLSTSWMNESPNFRSSHDTPIRSILQTTYESRASASKKTLRATTPYIDGSSPPVKRHKHPLKSLNEGEANNGGISLDSHATGSQHPQMMAASCDENAQRDNKVHMKHTHAEINEQATRKLVVPMPKSRVPFGNMNADVSMFPSGKLSGAKVRMDCFHDSTLSENSLNRYSVGLAP